MTIPELNLVNHFLIAMPSMVDPMFGGAVIYICEHNEQGALGLIVNKPTDIGIEDFYERIDLPLEVRPRAPLQPVVYGGPVQGDRGFVLHSGQERYSSSLPVTDDICFTTSLDVLEAVGRGEGPSRLLISIGYSGWGAGQLEQELAQNSWLSVVADPAILFDMPLAERHTAALKLLGIDPLMLTGGAGHA